MIELPIYTSYHRNIREPLLAAGWSVDSHIAVSVSSDAKALVRGARAVDLSEPELRQRIDVAYSPRSISLLWKAPPRCTKFIEYTYKVLMKKGKHKTDAFQAKTTDALAALTALESSESEATVKSLIPGTFYSFR